jgi:hypothetical protein
MEQATFNETIYRLLLWSLPVLLAILSFIGSLAVKALIGLGKDIHDIKTALQVEIVKRDALERRVDLHEKILDSLNHR